MPDQMKTRLGEIREVRPFLSEFLDIILSELTQSGGIGVPDVFSREFLCDRH